MISFERRRCLVLNKGWTHMHTIPLVRALHMVFRQRARIVNPDDYQAMTWEEWSELPPVDGDCIRGVNASFRVPEVIVLNTYDKIPQPRKTFSRRTLFKRDQFRCQYCGCQPGADQLTIDHVLPRAQGGQTTWENCVTACGECNSKKADHTPQSAGMDLLSVPAPPKYKLLRNEDYSLVPSWRRFIPVD